MKIPNNLKSKRIFGDEILKKINFKIILITYYSYEEYIYLMLIFDINKLNVLNTY